MDITAWLRELGLERYEQAFRENEIDAEILPTLTGEDLKDLGVSIVGHRRKLLNVIAALPGLDTPSKVAHEASVVLPGPVTAAPAREAERRQLTVMFVDLVGSTELSSKLDPEETGAIIRAYQNAVAGEITRFEGHVAKYMGDGVLAYFGYPKAHEDEAERAVRAALALADAVSKLATPAGRPLAARVGIATGLVVVGELIGEGSSAEQTVVGETPNLAARLQALAEPGGVVIAASTRRLLGGLFELADPGAHDLKGFGAPVEAWRVVGLGVAESRFEAMHPTDLTPLVGREHELGLLVDRWELARGSEGQAVLLAGEPGIGKSRLTQALLERIATEPHFRLRYYCSPYHTNSALHPVIEQLGRAARFAADDGTDAKLAKLEAVLGQPGDRLAEVAPLLAALCSLPTDDRYPPLHLTPQAQKVKTFEALLAQLKGLAANQPTLMLLEDAHWIDPSTSELFELVIDRVRRLPVLLVITSRLEFTPPWSGHAHVTSLTLSRLSHRRGAGIIELLAAGKALPLQVVEQILAKTDGVPLFVEELTKTVLESDLLREEDGAYVLDGSLTSLEIPSTLNDSLMARLDRLAPVREVAQTAACIGREFSYALLAAVSPLPEPKLAVALDQLIQSELVFRRGTPPDATYVFKHALVQDAAHQSLLKSKRQQLHARIVAQLQEGFSTLVDNQPEFLAFQCTEAGLIDEAVSYWVRAAQKAAVTSANREVIAHVERGLQLLRTLPKTEDRESKKIDLYYALGIAYRNIKGFSASETMKTFRNAMEFCKIFGEDHENYFDIQRGLYNCHFVGGNHREGWEIANDSMPNPKTADDELVAALMAGSCLLHRGRLGDARSTLERAIEIWVTDPSYARRTTVLDPPTASLMNLSWLLWLLGYPDQAMNTGDRAIRVSRESGQPWSVAVAMVWVGSMRICCGQRASIGPLLHDLKEVISDNDIAHWDHRVDFMHGKLLISENRREEGVSLIRRGLQTAQSTGSRLAWTWMVSGAVPELLDIHRIDEAAELLDEGLAFMEANDERFFEPELLRLKGHLAGSGPHPDVAAAEASSVAASDVASAQSGKSLELRAATSLARLWAKQGERQEAADLLVPIYGWFTEGFDTADLKDAKALLDELQ